MTLQFEPYLYLSQFELVDPSASFKDFSYKMPEKKLPYSLTYEEGCIMYEYIKRHELKSGFEIATAFGVSTMFIGNALKENGGKLTTMDAYIEETLENSIYGDVFLASQQVQNNIENGDMPVGYSYVKGMIDTYELHDTVKVKIGLSPFDITADLGPVDFAFIDGGHHGLQPLHDTVSSVHLMTGEKKVIFFHDNINNPKIDLAIQYAADRLQVTPIVFESKYRLTMVSNLFI